MTTTHQVTGWTSEEWQQASVIGYGDYRNSIPGITYALTANGDVLVARNAGADLRLRYNVPPATPDFGPAERAALARRRLRADGWPLRGR